MTGTRDATSYFDGRSASYDAQYDARSPEGYALRSRLAVVRRLVGPGPGELLDAGMGPGRLVAELEAAGWDVSGIDASPAMVEEARRRAPGAGGRLLRAEIEALPFPNESFDAVVATGVLEYADVHRALDELARVLRPGGITVVSYPNPRALYGIWKSGVHYPLVRALKRIGRRPEPWLPRGGPTIAPERFSAFLAETGLSVETVEPASYLVIPSPLDTVVAPLSARVGEALERRASSAAPVLATQVVYRSHKPQPDAVV